MSACVAPCALATKQGGSSRQKRGRRQALLEIEETLNQALMDSSNGGPRAYFVAADPSGKILIASSTMTASSNLEQDFGAISAELQDDSPGLVLIRAPHWGLLVWTPASCSVVDLTKCEFYRKSLQKSLALHVREHSAHTKCQVMLGPFCEGTRPTTAAECKEVKFQDCS